MNSIKTLNQERARFVLKKVKELSESDREKFKTNAKKVPSLIVSNGLLPTLAFLKAKDEKRKVYDAINEWMKWKSYCSHDILTELLNSDATKLRLATMEVLELANWLKRIVEIELNAVEESEKNKNA